MIYLAFAASMFGNIAAVILVAWVLDRAAKRVDAHEVRTHYYKRLLKESVDERNEAVQRERMRYGASEHVGTWQLYPLSGSVRKAGEA